MLPPLAGEGSWPGAEAPPSPAVITLDQVGQLKADFVRRQQQMCVQRANAPP